MCGVPKKDWMSDFAEKDNITVGTPDYVPMPLENISKYMKLPEFDEKCIKEIQTIGKVQTIFFGGAFFLVSPSQPEAKILAKYSKMSSESDMKPINQKFMNDLQEGDIVKVFGTLKTTEDSVFLNINLMLEVLDFEGSMQTLLLVSKLASYTYDQYYHTEEVQELMEETWKKMWEETKK